MSEEETGDDNNDDDVLVKSRPAWRAEGLLQYVYIV